MADFKAKLEPRFNLGEFLGSSRFNAPGVGVDTAPMIWRPASETVPSEITQHDIGSDLDHLDFEERSDPWENNDRTGKRDDRWDLADVWFEQAIVRPFSFAFDNILSTQTDSITVYSSFRFNDIELINVVNNLGEGVNLPDLPALPTTLQPQSGFVVTLEVTTDGSPTLNDTIDFVFDVDTQSVLITGQRIVMFPIQPEAPLVELLEFLTDVYEHLDGSEQRVSNRKNPRQSFEMTLAVDGNDRRFLENLLYDWQSRVFGIPVWTEPSILTAPASSGQSSVNVDDTTLGDFRVGGLCIVLTDRFEFDAMQIQSISPNSLTFTSPLQFDYPKGTTVYPLRTAVAQPLLRGSRALVNDETMEIRFRVLDNDVGDSFADTSAFNTLDGKVLLDGPNASEGRMTESLQRRLVEFDNLTGKFSVTSPWTRARRSSVKGFITHSRKELWEVRKLLHALRGRQTSFYLPTFYDEFELTNLLQQGSQQLNIVNVGFAQFAKARSPSRHILRVILKDGTILKRNITSAGAIDARREQVTVDVAWSNDIQIDEIERIEYVELVRADTDQFKIEHVNANGEAKLFFPVKAVFE